MSNYFVPPKVNGLTFVPPKLDFHWYLRDIYERSGGTLGSMFALVQLRPLGKAGYAYSGTLLKSVADNSLRGDLVLLSSAPRRPYERLTEDPLVSAVTMTVLAPVGGPARVMLTHADWDEPLSFEQLQVTDGELRGVANKVGPGFRTGAYCMTFDIQNII